ncbi:sterol desaturase family protein [Commensalibacter nepenthis]|uniref:Sterol desaturase family protein n=1 Tax=Commensalibacter nepenthis TaxID=3043872 RepID=A0ABT6Q9J6_9PROT|nr:sterol desaturase family protein [Commensalibacter sp. TBRC 10068]MDI2112980.1 sterol desaturase family protein [Commensalibacter sp. TBRC 10068]
MKSQSIFQIMRNQELRSGRSYDLGKMNLKELWVAYLTHGTILLYFSLILACIVGIYYTFTGWMPVLASTIVMILGFPLIWYIIHRWIMHATFLYQIKWTASLWKRIHFDHHQDPHLLNVLFGSPLNTIPTIIIVGGGIGLAVGGVPGAFAAIGTAIYMACFYEFFHCIQHLGYKPKSHYVLRIKQLHIMHHFHFEKGNYGITNYFWDRVFGTFYTDAKSRPRSPTVFNIGYDIKEAERYPWVMLKTGSPPRDRPEGSNFREQKKSSTHQEQKAA